MSRIFIIGDSTVEDNKPPFRGWGWAMRACAADGVEVCNHAISGRSTRSFLDEQRFEPVKEAMQPGDVLLIQFGHNDEKQDEERHTDPDSSYQEKLGIYCDAALERGTLPVLITPVSRRLYTEYDELKVTHGEYPAAMKAFAERRGLPCIDLYTASRELFIAIGRAETAKYFVHIEPGENPDFPDGHDDPTHFNAEGAEAICGLIVDRMRQDARLKAFVK